jgi:putative membrane protein
VIRNYSDHAANERTFLAWVRTGIAVIAFGLVIKKFDLFLQSIATLSHVDAERQSQLDRLFGPLGRYEGIAFVVVGVGLIALAAVRFVRTERLLDNQETSLGNGVRMELILSAALVLLVAIYSAYLVLG